MKTYEVRLNLSNNTYSVIERTNNANKKVIACDLTDSAARDMANTLTVAAKQMYDTELRAFMTAKQQSHANSSLKADRNDPVTRLNKQNWTY